MTILTQRVVWKRKKAPRRYSRVDALTPEEAANVRAALRELFAREGSWGAVAAQLGMHVKSLKRMMRSAWEPGAGHALKAARLLGVSVDAVIAGRGSAGCPTCGRST